MRGRVYLGFLIFSFSSFTTDTQACVQKKSQNANSPKFHYTRSSAKFTEPLEFAAEKFPELKGVRIDIRRKKISTMMAARPKLDFLFRKKEARRYVIYITNHPEMNAGPIFEDMSTCAQTGVLGHELSHILSYRKMNNMQLLWFGVKYLFHRKKIEAETDAMALKRGFGEELLEYTRFIYNSPHTNKRYLLKKKRHYLSVSEIQQMLVPVGVLQGHNRLKM